MNSITCVMLQMVKTIMRRNTTEKLQTLLTEQTHLVLLLDRSLAIKHLWRSVFDYGNVKSQWIPTGEKRSRMDQLRNPEAHFGETLLVTNGMGDTKKFPYEDVPQCLGGGKVLSSVAAAKDQ